MLSKAETDGCRHILQKLTSGDIRSLVYTYKKRAVSGKSEGIETILKCTRSPLALLKQKKIKRDILFFYLNEKLIQDKEMVFPDTSKMRLILEIQNRWATHGPNIKVEETGSELVSEDISRREISPLKSAAEIKKERMEPANAVVSNQNVTTSKKKKKNKQKKMRKESSDSLASETGDKNVKEMSTKKKKQTKQKKTRKEASNSLVSDTGDKKKTRKELSNSLVSDTRDKKKTRKELSDSLVSDTGHKKKTRKESRMVRHWILKFNRKLELDLMDCEVRGSSSQDLAANLNQGTPFIGVATSNQVKQSNHTSSLRCNNVVSQHIECSEIQPRCTKGKKCVYSQWHLNNTGVDNSDLTILFECDFLQWFYENLNSFCPTMQHIPQDFGPHHFWDDCYLVIKTWTPNIVEEVFFGNPVLIAERLLKIPKKEHLLFKPNLTREGMFVKSNTDGLVEILVCGTIHCGNNCQGVFQQLFRIMKDPSCHGNWKIKMTKLYLKMQAFMDMLKLEGNPEQLILDISSDLKVGF